MAMPRGKSASGFTPEEMKDFVRKHFDDFINKKKSDVAYSNFSDGFIDYSAPQGRQIGPQSAKELIEGYYQQYPGLHVEINNIFVEDDKVVVRCVWTYPATKTRNE